MPAPVVSGSLPLSDTSAVAVWSDVRVHEVSRPSPRVGIDPCDYLNRLFYDMFGISVSVALESLRCSRAEAMLTRTDLTIAAVARQCGYADVAHFSHRLSGIHGISPSAYRNLANRSPSVLEQPGVLQLGSLIWN